MNLSSIASRAFDAGLSLCFPQPCAVCGRSVESRHDGVACHRCWSQTPLFDGSETVCWKCGALSRGRVNQEKRETVRCGRCNDDAFANARACGFYKGALRASVIELKRQPHLSQRVVALLDAVRLREPFASAEIIVPVPLHPEREQARGFNQAAIVAHALGRVSQLPVDEHSVIRRVHTERHRGGMDSKARRQSVADAFAAWHTDLILEKHILLVDDVFTTGATVSACAKALVEGGARDVFVLTMARAVD